MHWQLFCTANMAPPVRFELTTYISRHFIDNHYQYPKFYFHQNVRILITHPFPFVVYGSFHYRDCKKTSIGYSVSVCSLLYHSDRPRPNKVCGIEYRKAQNSPSCMLSSFALPLVCNIYASKAVKRTDAYASNTWRPQKHSCV